MAAPPQLEYHCAKVRGLNLMVIDGGPTAIRTRVRGSASHCDIQATLWGQCNHGHLPSPFKRSGVITLATQIEANLSL